MITASEFIPLSVPHLSGNEWDYVKECLDTGWVSSVGAYVERFEQELAAFVDLPHAVATASGTAALHTAMLVADVQPGDEVLVSDLTFVAPANAIRYVGAHPVFIDPEPDYWQIDPQKVAAFLSNECHWKDGQLTNRTTGRRVKAIVPVHILGHPADVDALWELAGQYNLVVIADTTECLGTRYKDAPACHRSHIACYSFNGNKIMTTGNGGMLVTSNGDWAGRAKYLTTQAKDDPVEYVHEAIGYNYRLSNIQAAIGCAQLEQMPDFIARKRQIAETYHHALQDIAGITPMPEAQRAYSTYWMYTILIDENHYGMDSRELMKQLEASDIQARPLWRPLHMLTPFQPEIAYQIEVSPRLYRQALSIPCSVGLAATEQDRVIDVIRRCKGKG